MKPFSELLSDALIAEQQGRLNEAEGLYNDAISAASARSSMKDCAACYYQLALFFQRAGRMDEAGNIRKIADLITRSLENPK